MEPNDQIVSVEKETDNWFELINQNRVELVKNINFDRQLILTYLQSKNIIDEEDIDIIRGAGPSRQQQVSKFLDILSRTGKCGWHVFLEVLEIENQVLFEIITGKKASKRFNLGSSLNTAPYSVQTNQQLLDHDRKYLASELEKLASTNYRMSQMQSKLTKEKCLLQEENRKLSQVIAEKNFEIEKLEKNLINQKTLLSVKSNKEEGLTRYFLKAQENAEQSQLIINYLAKIMAMKDEQEILHKENNALKMKNNSLLQKIDDLSSDYKWQRSRSELLSKQVEQSKNELKDVQLSKKKLCDLESELTRVTQERDAALQRLKEFRDVMTALNIKCHILRNEKFVEAEKRGEVSKECANLEEENNKLNLELKFEVNKTEMLQQKYQSLQKDNATFNEQYCYYLNERAHLITERDQLAEECDIMKKSIRELRESRDEAIKKHLEVSQLLEKTRLDFDEKLHKLVENLHELQEELQQTKKRAKTQICPSNMSTGCEIEEKTYSSNSTDIELGTCFYYRRDTDLLKSAREKLCLSEGDLTKNSQASNYQEMIDVFNDLRSPKSKVVETFPTIPSSYPPSCPNGYQVNSIKNPMLAEIFPHEKRSRIRSSESLIDLRETSQSQIEQTFTSKKADKENKNGGLRKKMKQRLISFSNQVLHHPN